MAHSSSTALSVAIGSLTKFEYLFFFFRKGHHVDMPTWQMEGLGLDWHKSLSEASVTGLFHIPGYSIYLGFRAGSSAGSRVPSDNQNNRSMLLVGVVIRMGHGAPYTDEFLRTMLLYGAKSWFLHAEKWICSDLWVHPPKFCTPSAGVQFQKNGRGLSQLNKLQKINKDIDMTLAVLISVVAYIDRSP